MDALTSSEMHILELALREMKGLSCTGGEARQAAAQALENACRAGESGEHLRDPWGRWGRLMRVGLNAILEQRRGRARMERFMQAVVEQAQPQVGAEKVPSLLARMLCRRLECSWSDAEECAQHALLKACEKAAAGHPPVRPWSWLYKVGKLAIVTRHRRQKTAAKHRESLAYSRPHLAPAPETGREEFVRLAEEAIAELPIDRQEVWRLHFKDQSADDIASEFGVDPRTIRRWLAEIRRVVAARLESHV